MQILHDKKKLREIISHFRRQGKTIGFVPTMGSLHAGHLSLVRSARRQNDVVVASIFVNPTQFGPNEDFEAYPCELEKDSQQLAQENTDLLFAPSADSIYPPGYATYVETGGTLTQGLCGQTRPGHFKGVTTVVAKLFHLVAPDRAYFGQKDAQQVAVIKQMVADLDFDLEVVACPTVREPDGLAMSSRNQLLSPSQRAQAVTIYQTLVQAEKSIQAGERAADTICQDIVQQLNTIAEGTVDYVAVVDARHLEDIEIIHGDVLIAVAVKLGATRLIDNLPVSV